MEIAKLGAEVDSSGAKKGAQEVNNAVNGMANTADKATAKTTSGFDKLKKNLFSFKGAVASLGIAALFTNSIKTSRQFEQAIAELGAITGATGKDLKFLSDASKEFGRTTTLSATEAATAFKLVASAKPDLLENVSALKAVTKEAIILAEAAGTTLPDAANTLGSSLNQFSAEADQAGRFINVLAAGSKLGASEVTATSAALEKAGVVASVAGLSFEETNAAVQLLAKGAIKGEMAGTGLRGVLLKLTTQANDQFNPAVVGMEQALKNLAAAELSATEKKNLFGQESITSAELLLKEADSFGALTKALTGTNTAQEQAIKNTDTFDGSMKGLGSAWEGFMLSINSSNGLLRSFVDLMAEGLRGVTAVSEALSGAPEQMAAYSDWWKGLALILYDVKMTFVKIGELIGATAAATVAAATGDFSAASNIMDQYREKVKLMEKDRESFGVAMVTGGGDATPTATGGGGGITPPPQDTGGGVVKASFDEDAFSAELERQKAFEDRLTALKLESLEGRDLAVANYTEEKKELDMSVLEGEIEEIYEYNALKEAIELKHQANMAKIEKKSAEAKKKFDQNTRKQNISATVGFFNNLSTLMNSNSKSQFEIGKKAAIAGAMVKGGQAAVNSFEAGSKINPYVGAAFAAASLIATGAQIQNIKSQQFGGGGGTTGSGAGISISGGQSTGQGGVGGASELGFESPVTESATSGTVTNQIDINLGDDDELITKGAVRNLIGKINVEIGDGATLRTS